VRISHEIGFKGSLAASVPRSIPDHAPKSRGKDAVGGEVYFTAGVATIACGLHDDRRDADEPRDLRVVAGFADDSAAVRVADENSPATSSASEMVGF
jgi:hypothetical protein